MAAISTANQNSINILVENLTNLPWYKQWYRLFIPSALLNTLHTFADKRNTEEFNESNQALEICRAFSTGTGFWLRLLFSSLASFARSPLFNVYDSSQADLFNGDQAPINFDTVTRYEHLNFVGDLANAGLLTQNSLDLVRRHGPTFIYSLSSKGLLTKENLTLVEKYGTDFISNLDEKELLTQKSLELVERYGTDFISALDRNGLLTQGNINRVLAGKDRYSVSFIHFISTNNIISVIDIIDGIDSRAPLLTDLFAQDSPDLDISSILHNNNLLTRKNLALMKKHGLPFISLLNLTDSLIQDTINLVEKYGTDFILVLDIKYLLTRDSLALVKKYGTEFIYDLDRNELLTQDSLALVKQHGTSFICDLERTGFLVRDNLVKLANCDSLVFIQKLKAVNLLTQANIDKVTRFKNTDFVQYLALRLSDISPEHPMGLLLSTYSHLTQKILDQVVEYDPSFVSDLGKNSLMIFFDMILQSEDPYFVSHLAAARLLDEHNLSKVLRHQNPRSFRQGIQLLAGSPYLTQVNIDQMVTHENPRVFAEALLVHASTLREVTMAHQEASTLVNGPHMFKHPALAADSGRMRANSPTPSH